MIECKRDEFGNVLIYEDGNLTRIMLKDQNEKWIRLAFFGPVAAIIAFAFLDKLI